MEQNLHLSNRYSMLFSYKSSVCELESSSSLAVNFHYQQNIAIFYSIPLSFLNSIYFTFVVVPPKCKDLKLDLAIVLEASKELGLQHFFDAATFIDNLLHLFDISPDGTHVHIVLYSRIAYSIISFDQLFYQSSDAVAAILNYLIVTPFLISGKRLDMALEYVNDNVFTAERGDRPDAENIAVFVTDGIIQNGQDHDISETVSSLKVK